FQLQAQASYPLETVKVLDGVPLAEPVRETSFSTSVSYFTRQGDRLDINTLFRDAAEPRLRAQNIILGITKVLPTYFDVRLALEYSFLEPLDPQFSKLRGYEVELLFRRKPRSCWNFSIVFGQNEYRQHY